MTINEQISGWIHYYPMPSVFLRVSTNPLLNFLMKKIVAKSKTRTMTNYRI